MNVEHELAEVRTRSAKRADALFGQMIQRIEDARRAEGFLPPLAPVAPPFVPRNQAEAWGYLNEQFKMGLESLARSFAAGAAAARAGR